MFSTRATLIWLFCGFIPWFDSWQFSFCCQYQCKWWLERQCIDRRDIQLYSLVHHLSWWAFLDNHSVCFKL